MKNTKKIKKCYKCGVEKTLSEFYKDRKRGDGRQSRCKECNRKPFYLIIPRPNKALTSGIWARKTT